MLWTTFLKKGGKQPLYWTNRNHVEAVINGNRIRMTMKYDNKGRPYLVPEPEEQEGP